MTRDAAQVLVLNLELDPPNPSPKQPPPGREPLICQGQRNKPLSWSCWHIFDFFSDRVHDLGLLQGFGGLEGV